MEDAANPIASVVEKIPIAANGVIHANGNGISNHYSQRRTRKEKVEPKEPQEEDGGYEEEEEDDDDEESDDDEAQPAYGKPNGAKKEVKRTPFVKRMVYIAGFVKDIALWVGGFTVVNLAARAKLDFTIVLLLMLAFISFTLGLVGSFMGSLLAARWFSDICEPKARSRRAFWIRTTMVTSGILCLLGLVFVIIALFFIENRTRKAPSSS
jgi:hypothetical protein